MAWQDEYRDKHMTVDEMFRRFLPNGSKVYCGGLNTPNLLVDALVEKCAAGELVGIQMFGSWVQGGVKFVDVQVDQGHYRYHSVFPGWNERGGMASGCVDTIPIHYMDLRGLAESEGMDVLVAQVTPPDENGVCSMGPNGSNASALPHCKHVLAQVNRNLPRVTGEEFDLPVNRISAFVDGDEPTSATLQPPKVNVAVQRIADFVVERISDGDCIQLGIGSIPEAIGRGLFNHKHLGVYSEMYAGVMMELQKAGVVDNSRKSFMPGVSVAGFTDMTDELLTYLDGNPDVVFKPFHWICDPRNVAQNDNFVSINSALSVDVTGQVGAESIGTRQFSDTGGQVGFVMGAQWAKGGQSFIAFESVANTKNGPVSKIAVTLAPGTVVTTPRTSVQYLVTEYGCVDVKYCSIPERVRRIVSIAHPDFREQLTYDAKKLGLLY